MAKVLSSVKLNKKLGVIRKVVKPEPEPEPVLDITLLEIRHSIYGLHAYVTMVDDIILEIDRKGLIYELHEYLNKWCFVFNKDKENLDVMEYRNVIYSFIRSILNTPITHPKHINMDTFKPLMNDDGTFEKAYDITNKHMLELINNIVGDSGFLIDEEKDNNA